MSEQLDKLAFSFFKLFAQYEYALKAMRFARSGAGGQAEPDWDRFSNEIGSLVLNKPNKTLLNATSYLFENPPKKQVLIDGVISWQPVPNTERSAQMLFSHIRRVRNNLYHGGKFHGHWLDPDRSEELISKSLVVLKELKSMYSDLKEAIRGNHA